MRQIIIKDRQTITDVALQYTGDPAAASVIAKMNGYSVSAGVEPGTALLIPGTINGKIVDFFSRAKVYPAMKIDNSGKPGGIGYMQIGIDFIIS